MLRDAAEAARTPFGFWRLAAIAESAWRRTAGLAEGGDLGVLLKCMDGATVALAPARYLDDPLASKQRVLRQDGHRRAPGTSAREQTCP